MVRGLLEPLCDGEGVELVHIEYQREMGGRVLRLYIDRPGGVTLDDCVNISRQSGDLLDVHIENIGPYSLEVSSPGPDRPLGKKEDFVKFKGKKARIKTVHAFEGRKKFKGVLLGTSGEAVQLLVNDQTVSIPLEKIARARLVDYRPDPDALDAQRREKGRMRSADGGGAFEDRQ